MKNNLAILAILAILFIGNLISLAEVRAQSLLIDVYQPTSLSGTEMEGDPLGTGEGINAVIVSRPVVVDWFFPKSTVHAISLPHKIANSPDGFPEESNLIVTVGGNVYVKSGEAEDQIIADFSKAMVPKRFGVTLIQVMKMTAIC